MIKTAILIDGGYFLRRLPVVRPDVDANDPKAVAQSVTQLVRGHLSQLNALYQVPNPLQLLNRTFYYDAHPYDGKQHTPLTNVPSTIPGRVKQLSERGCSKPCTIVRISPCGWVRFARIVNASGF